MDIYADVLFLVNLVLNGMLLRITARAGGARLSALRLLSGAAFGGAAAIALTALQLPSPAALLLKLMCAPLMCLIAFGRRGIWRNSLLLLTVTFLFGGGIWALSLLFGGAAHRVGGISYAAVTLPSLFLSAAGIYALLSFAAGRWCARIGTGTLRRIRCEAAGRTAVFDARLDPGCTLRDPASNIPVLLAEEMLLQSLVSPDTLRLLRRVPAEGLPVLAELPEADLSRIRIVPCRTVTGSALLPAFRPDRLTVDGRPVTGLVALCPMPISDAGARALVGEI